jgi:hypothetical protein
MTDRGHQRQVDSIAGTTPAYDPSTGQTWQVEDGYDRYFMNSFGEYMSTDDQFYNPNMDPAVNDREPGMMIASANDPLPLPEAGADRCPGKRRVRGSSSV